MENIKARAIFRHYKGQTYLIHGLVRHSETLEELVCYECLYENELGKMWVRPVEIFLSKVKVDGLECQRFTYIGDQEDC